MSHHIRIETPKHLSYLGTKISVDGQEIDKVRAVTFHQEAGNLPRLTIEAFGVDTVIDGAMEVQRLTVCPACKKRLADNPNDIAAHDVTDLDDQWMSYVAGPKEPAD